MNRKAEMRGIVCVLIVLLAGVVSAEPPPFDNGKVSFAVSVRDETVDYGVFAGTVLPGGVLPVAVRAKPVSGVFEAETTGGELREAGPGKWQWTAPKQVGLYSLTIRSKNTGESMRLNLFVLVPRTQVQDGSLNGYRIDSYPATAFKGLEIYKPPRGFIEVTEANVDTPVSPHFTLGQFLCKQSGGWPKYVVLRERLLLKLELLLEQVNAAGFRTDTFHVMSGYRTPYYNRAIGNVKYSRHVYGGAADIFIDEQPRDGVMDDLNQDGRIDVHDAGVLYDLIDRLYGTEIYEPYVGGLGRYKKTSAHGPFVHVDVRGFRARWGD
jgi:hypothetical protein